MRVFQLVLEILSQVIGWVSLEKKKKEAEDAQEEFNSIENDSHAWMSKHFGVQPSSSKKGSDDKAPKATSKDNAK